MPKKPTPAAKKVQEARKERERRKRENERRLKKAKFGMYRDTNRPVYIVEDRIYECRVIQKRVKNPRGKDKGSQLPGVIEYLIHYCGWSTRHDKWVPEVALHKQNPLDEPDADDSS